MPITEDFMRLANDVSRQAHYRSIIFGCNYQIEHQRWELVFWQRLDEPKIVQYVTRLQVIELRTTSALLLLLSAIFEQAKAELEAMAPGEVERLADRRPKSFENYRQNYTSISRDELTQRMREAAASVTFNGVIPAHNTDLWELPPAGAVYANDFPGPTVVVRDRPRYQGVAVPADPPKPKRPMVTADGRPVRRFVVRPEKTT